MAINRRRREQGATALIVVVFSVLLLVTVSVGFMRLVVQDQERTLNDELSRGAYDSAVAGVEDGKRVLQACIAGDAVACAAISAGQCNTINASKILSASADPDPNNSEVFLKSSAGTTGGFDQAYTCVKINRNTDDYQGTLNADTSQVIPLQTTGDFTTIIVSWFLNPGPDTVVDLNANGQLPANSAWSPVGRVRPPTLRAQLMQYTNGSFSLGDFDQNGGGHTLYLYPSNAGASTTNPVDFVTDGRHSDTNQLLKAVHCSTGTLTSQYVCSVALTLPLPVGAASPSERRAYLRLTSLYGPTDYVIQTVGTQLQDVQPAIDSTGRASNVFRRLRSRVELVSPADAYPRATVDLTKNFCKDFAVSATQAPSGSTCSYTLP